MTEMFQRNKNRLGSTAFSTFQEEIRIKTSDDMDKKVLISYAVLRRTKYSDKNNF